MEKSYKRCCSPESRVACLPCCLSVASTGKDICCDTNCEEPYGRSSQVALFVEYCKNGLNQLGIKNLEDTALVGIWKETQPFIDLMNPFWCLRAALGPLVETYILLDWLLFLQEQGSKVEVELFPLFDPLLSPRNVAIIAQKK